MRTVAAFRTSTAISIICTAALAFACLGIGCATVARHGAVSDYESALFARAGHPYCESGRASYYPRILDGQLTASGEYYNKYELTAAHPALPFNTLVQVTSLLTHESVIVRINDRGPNVKNYVVQLSYEAARKIGLIDKATTRITLRVVQP
jgi:rare lipoprotein A